MTIIIQTWIEDNVKTVQYCGEKAYIIMIFGDTWLLKDAVRYEGGVSLRIETILVTLYNKVVLVNALTSNDKSIITLSFHLC